MHFKSELSVCCGSAISQLLFGRDRVAQPWLLTAVSSVWAKAGLACAAKWRQCFARKSQLGWIIQNPGKKPQCRRHYWDTWKRGLLEKLGWQAWCLSAPLINQGASPRWGTSGQEGAGLSRVGRSLSIGAVFLQAEGNSGKVTAIKQNKTEWGYIRVNEEIKVFQPYTLQPVFFLLENVSTLFCSLASCCLLL